MNAHSVTVDHRSDQVLELLDDLRMFIDRAHHCGLLDTTIAGAAHQKLVAIARASRASGLFTYCSMSLNLLEQVWPMSRGEYISVQLSELISTWAALSIWHFEKPTSFPRMFALVEFLADRRWERPVGQAHRQALLLGLREDWFSCIEEFHMSSEVFSLETRGIA